MTLVSSLAFPGSKTLAGWWRQLASHQPRAFGVGYLFMHRVEAAALVEKPRKVDPFVHLLLQALDRESSAVDATDATRRDLLSRLEGRLCLNRQVLFQVLRSLEGEDLAQNRSGAWGLTDKGKRALANGEYPVQAVDRRAFHFLERWHVSGERAPPPHFVSLRGDGGQAWTATEDCPFDVALVQDCVQRSAEWKSRFGFPLEIQRTLGPSSTVAEERTAEPDAWQRVIVDRPERYLAVWVLVPGPSEPSCLLAFAARQDGWALNSNEPLMRIADWQEVLPSLSAAPDAENLRRAWKAWAHSRGLTDADTDASALSLLGHCLEVQTTPAALERLKKAKSDVFKGDTWLLIGDGLIRTAVVLRLR